MKLGITCLLFFTACFWRLTLLARVEGMGGDETTDISGSFDNTFLQLLVSGPPWELNASPFYYMIGRLWLLAWQMSPHQHWDTRIFFRVLPMLCWSLATVVVFLFLRSRLQRLSWHPAAAFAAALGFSSLLFFNQFPQYYSVLSRPYSLWLLLTILHLIFFLCLYEEKKITRVGYAICCVLLPFTAYISILQVGASVAACLALPPGRNIAQERRWQLYIATASLAIAFWYLTRTYEGDVKASQAGTVLNGFLDILMAATQPFKSSHFSHRALFDIWASASWIARSWSITVLLLPLLRYRRKGLQPFLLFGYGLTASLVLIAFFLHLKGQYMGEPRYLLFLLPVYYGFLLISLHSFIEVLERVFHKKLTPLMGAALGICFFGFGIYSSVLNTQNTLHTAPDLFEQRLVWNAPKEGCPARLDVERNGKSGIETERLAELCRP